MRHCLFLLCFLFVISARSPREKPVSQAEALSLAVRIERSIVAGSPSVLDALLDSRLLSEPSYRTTTPWTGA